MKSSRMFVCAVASLAVGASVLSFACGDDGVLGAADLDASDDRAAADVAVASDGGSEAAPGDAAVGTPPWLLLSLNYTTQSEVVAYSVPAKKVDGRLAYSGFIGQTVSQDGHLYLLEQKTDRVVALDPQAPWKAGPSWDVHGTDSYDGGLSYADPIAVVHGPGAKAYVLRFNRNQIAVLDRSNVGADAAPPVKTIDLASLLDTQDKDGHVDMSAAVYVGAKQRLYVVVGNWDLTYTPVVQTVPYTPCLASQPFVVAIDTSTDALVSLGGAAPGGGIYLGGYNPMFGGTFYDAARDRLLVVQNGCNVELAGDAGMGPVSRREIDALDLGSGTASVALDLDARGYPSALARLDATHWVLGFDFGAEAYRWDLSSDAGLGAPVDGAPDLFVYDGHGALVGMHTDYFSDGGNLSNVVSVSLADGGATTLGPVPFAEAGGFSSAVDIWPAP